MHLLASEGPSPPHTYNLFIHQAQPFHATASYSIALIIPAMKIAKLFLTHLLTYSTTASNQIYHCVRFVKIQP